jgi:dihydrodipicolinate synthase/N-acetylneuraminate lyase
VVRAVRAPSVASSERLRELRAQIETFPRHAALKHVLRRRGVSLRADVRRPLRPLTEDEQARLDDLVPTWLEASADR